MSERILVYGGRNFGVLTDERGAYVGMDAKAACAILSQLSVLDVEPEDTIVSGGATGADALGEMVGNALSMNIEIHEANWDRYGRSAGPKRNKEMLESGLDCAIKCPGGRGTAHMTNLLLKAGVPTYEVQVQD